jgi:hypothetical protein
MNEINISMKEVIVKSESRPLRSKWTTELSSDLEVYINTDIEAALEKELGDEIRREMRKKKIEKILKHIG